MTNYDKIKKYIEHGFWVVCKKGQENVLFTGMSYHLMRYSSNICFDLCLNNTGIRTMKEEEINRRVFDSMTPIYPPFKYYQVGDLVDVLETTMDLPWYDACDDETKSFVGIKWVSINEVTSSWYILSMKLYNRVNKYWSYTVWLVSDKKFIFPHHVLAPHIPDESIDTIKIGGMEYSLQDVEERLKDLKPIQK